MLQPIAVLAHRLNLFSRACLLEFTGPRKKPGAESINIYSCFGVFGKALLLKRISSPTPVLIAVSATLNTGLKNEKENISTTFPCNHFP